jgi:hypothetical protein
LSFVLLAACSHGQKKTTPELSKLEGKKVALTDIDGEETARRVIEVALINQLTQRGTFIIVSRQDVEAARKDPAQNPTDWVGVARRAGADYALKAKVLQFDGDIREGYSSTPIQDSQLAAERGDDGKDERIYKVKSLDGTVKVELDFAATSGDDYRSGVAEKEDRVVSEGKDEAAHLPPKLRFLETLSNGAFKDFFDRYN